MKKIYADRLFDIGEPAWSDRNDIIKYASDMWADFSDIRR